MRDTKDGIRSFELERTQYVLFLLYFLFLFVISITHCSISRNLLKNLENGLKLGHNFGLKSCMRIRASGCYHSSTKKNKLEKSSQQNRITIKFEIFIPNISFSARQILPLPIHLNPLVQMLTASLERSSEDIILSHQMGYITMTETRKLFLLNESDSNRSNIMSSPVIGVWIALPDMTLDHHSDLPYENSCLDSSSGRESNSMLLNPIIWGCCVRYLCNQNILEKVWIDETTFLLV